MPGDNRVFTTASKEIDRASMGAIPAAVLERPAHQRGNHPLSSFSAVGPLARDLVRGQAPLDIYAPLRRLAELDGVVILMGVGLDRLTLLHLAEQQAGRRMFRRWANGPDGQPAEVDRGGCSAGFVRLGPILAGLARETQVGASPWLVYPAREALDVAAAAIRHDPEITHCATPDCVLCACTIAGGPILPGDPR
jgi:aminoglycoside 3-N-acetyltransferase